MAVWLTALKELRNSHTSDSGSGLRPSCGRRLLATIEEVSDGEGGEGHLLPSLHHISLTEVNTIPSSCSRSSAQLAVYSGLLMSEP